MNKPSQKSLTSLIIILLSIFACAKEGIPPGGPEDTQAPEILSVLPESGTTEVSLTSKIEILFSERMEPSTTEGSIFISPLPKEPFEFGWKGKKLILTPASPLQPNRTYVISIGADAQDLRRNRLGRTYTFAFSTGSRLDFGTISGQVWIRPGIGFRKEAGAGVYAYLLDQIGAEIDPAIQKPDYVTQTDNEGRYLLKNLSLGTYRLFAVQDLNRDLIWDWEKESIGVTTKDIQLTGQDVSTNEVDFVLGKKDKKNPSLLNCYSLNRNSVRLEFDEELDERSVLNVANYRISSAVTGTQVDINSSFFQDQDSQKVILQTEQTVPREEYNLFVLSVNDRAGNPIDSSTNSCRFAGTDIQDTIGPTVVRIIPAAGQIDVPLNSQIILALNEPPDHQSFEASFLLIDSTKKEIAGKGEWINPNVYRFSPALPLPSNMQLLINLSGKGIYDKLGNPSGLDSAFSSSFVTLNQEELGSVSGMVTVKERTEEPNIVLSLWHIQRKDVFYRIVLKQPGPFQFDAAIPGKYFLSSYLDLDQNGVLSMGNPEPFSPMEQFKIYADTINVRSRWETEGVEIEFQER